MIQINLFTRQKWTHKYRNIENKLMVTKGDSGGGGKLGVWDQHIHTAIYKIYIK